MAMLGIRLIDHPDTTQVAKETLNQLRHFSISSLINHINKGLPVSVMKSLLYNPVDWSFAHEHEKYVYLSLLEWLGQASVKIKMNNLDIDTFELCRSRFVNIVVIVIPDDQAF